MLENMIVELLTIVILMVKFTKYLVLPLGAFVVFGSLYLEITK